MIYTPGPSEIFIREGFLCMSYDGDSSVKATSTFNFYDSTFEVSAELRQAFDPVYFSIYNDQNTATFELRNNGDYTSSLYTGGETYNCWGTLNNRTSVEDQYFTDYVCVSSEDVQNKYVSLTYLIADTTNVAMNIVGGPPQGIDTDFYIQNNKIRWDNLSLDGEVNAGDIIRVLYIAEGLSNPTRIKFVLKDNIMTVFGVNNGHFEKLMRRTMHSSLAGPWKVSFYMDNKTHIGAQMGRGYVSKFLAVAESFTDTDKAKPYELKTWRQPVIFYNS
jgi:hypothetical protein